VLRAAATLAGAIVLLVWAVRERAGVPPEPFLIGVFALAAWVFLHWLMGEKPR